MQLNLWIRINSINNKRRFSIKMCILFVQSFNLLNVLGLYFMNFTFCYGFMTVMFFLEFDSFPHHGDHFKIRIQEKQPSTHEEHRREFKLIYLVPQPYKVVKCPKLFMFVQNDCWVNCVTIFQSILYKSKPFLYVNSQLIRGC